MYSKITTSSPILRVFRKIGKRFFPCRFGGHGMVPFKIPYQMRLVGIPVALYRIQSAVRTVKDIVP